MTKLVPASDVRPAEWVITGLRGFAESVQSLVPEGFPKYARVFHPAYLRDEPVRWADIASANGKVAHVGMQLDALTGSADSYNIAPQPGLFDYAPRDGTLPINLVRSLLPVLARHTTAPATCWFAVWEGWGGLRRDLATAPKFDLPGRSYHLLSGPIEAAAESVDDVVVDSSLAFLSEFAFQSASLWWPDDHAWCVATEIDFVTTYIGCDERCSDEILRLGDVESFEVDPAARGSESW
jgi:hypothetical protein